jgi:heterodisulfide reductase subunit C
MQLGAGEEILNSDIIWTCSSCETCFARCPMEIDMPAVMDALRILAVQRRAPTSKGDIPLFNRTFLKTVSMFGRTYDLAMIAAYKLRTSTVMQDMNKLPAMLKKRKIAILPPRGADKKTVKRIFDSVSHKKGIRK